MYADLVNAASSVALVLAQVKGLLQQTIGSKERVLLAGTSCHRVVCVGLGLPAESCKLRVHYATSSRDQLGNFRIKAVCRL